MLALTSSRSSLLLVLLAVGCAHSDSAPKKKRHRKASAAQDANAPAGTEGSSDDSDDSSEPATKPRALGPETWQVEADGRTLEEAAQRAVHEAMVWCGERKQVPLPETDSARHVARGIRVTFVFHCVQVQADPPPMPMMDLNPMPLDPD